MSDRMSALQRELDGPIPPEAIQRRKAFGRGPNAPTLDYVEGWWVIHQLNRVFPLQWSRRTELLELGVEERQKGQTRYVAHAVARVTLEIHVPDGVTISRDGIGAGSGFAEFKGPALEDAAKEAETDALKRAAVTLGLAMGLRLYDKHGVLERNGSSAPSEPATESLDVIATRLEQLLTEPGHKAEVIRLMKQTRPDGVTVAKALEQQLPELLRRARMYVKGETS